MRVGSVVTQATIDPTPRPYVDHRAYCLYFADGTCGRCIDRCPVRAITEAGHDKEKCRLHLTRAREHVQKTYRFEGYGCGLCQVGVPCEDHIPVKAARAIRKMGPETLVVKKGEHGVVMFTGEGAFSAGDTVAFSGETGTDA